MQDPNKALWAAVLEQLWHDATSRETTAYRNGYALPTPDERERARRMFERPSRDLEMICQFAGIEPEFARRRFHETLQKQASA